LTEEERIAEESAAEARKYGADLFPPQKGAKRTECFDPGAPLTPEEQRLTRATGPNPESVADQLLRRSGFDRLLEPFDSALWVASVFENRAASPSKDIVTRQDGPRHWTDMYLEASPCLT
jgi:hypothetical protein